MSLLSNVKSFFAARQPVTVTTAAVAQAVETPGFNYLTFNYSGNMVPDMNIFGLPGNQPVPNLPISLPGIDMEGATNHFVPYSPLTYEASAFGIAGGFGAQPSNTPLDVAQNLQNILPNNLFATLSNNVLNLGAAPIKTQGAGAVPAGSYIAPGQIQ